MHFANIMRLAGVAAFVAAEALLFVPHASAQPFPSRYVKVIIPNPAGGPLDVLTRAIGEGFRERTGQSLVVESRPGGATTIGAAACKNSTPDGYTICLLTSGTITLNPFLYKSLPYDPEKDLEPITNLVTVRQVVMVGASVEAKTFQDLVAWSRKNPDKLAYGSIGPGSDAHLQIEWLAKKTGLKALHVPYQGATPALLALDTGEVQMTLLTASELVLERIRSGKARALLVTSSKRDPNLPDVPTMQEAGLESIGYQTWFGFFAPAGTPADRIETLSKIIGDIVRSDSFRTKYLTGGFDAVGDTPAEFKKALEARRKAGKALIEISGVTIAQ